MKKRSLLALSLFVSCCASAGAQEWIGQSTAKRAILKLYSSTDHISPVTGATLTVAISANGGSFGAPSAGATATEIANGWYYIGLSTTDTGTLGPLIIRGTATGADPSEVWYDVQGTTTLTQFGAAVANSILVNPSNKLLTNSSGYVTATPLLTVTYGQPIWLKQTGQGVWFYATLSSGAPDTGDAANITSLISKDGAAPVNTVTAHPTEIGLGVYWQPLAESETAVNATLVIVPSSTTSGVTIPPIIPQISLGPR